MPLPRALSGHQHVDVRRGGLGLPHDLTRHFNFFRIHLLTFTFVPVVFACIFYAGNGSATGNANSGDLGVKKVEFIDSLFLCFSAMTVTGLVTVNVSATHPFQQALLLILFIFGDYSVVSLVMVLVRKRFFRQHCMQLLRNDQLRRTNTAFPEGRIFSKSFTFNPKAKPKQPVNLDGGISGPMDARPMNGVLSDSPTDMTFGERFEATDEHPYNGQIPSSRDTEEQSPSSSRDVQVTTPSQHQYHARQRVRAASRARSVPHILAQRHPVPLTLTTSAHPHHLDLTAKSPVPPHAHHHSTSVSPMLSGFGGFPGPIEIIGHLLPTSTRQDIRRRLSHSQRKMTLLTSPHTPTLPSLHEMHMAEESWTDSIKSQVARWMPESLNGLVIGRNSRFYTEELSDDELEQLGGVEYRALRTLSYLVAGYIFFFQTIPFAIIAIYFAKVNYWDGAFQATQGVQAATVNKTWYSLFQVVAAYTGAGMSLLDQSMIPLANCYLLMYLLDIAMVAGNHALPMTLRLVIWIGTKIYRKGGEKHESLHFLLDHPRRCFLYLFPSHQTWYLVLILVAFMFVEIFSFLVLNIGLPVLSSIPSGWQMFSEALLQSLSVRASGFGIVSVPNLAPAVLFVYIILMYVAIYPIAMSVRSTNVYEERALGVYKQGDDDSDGNDGPEPEFKGHRREVFSKYLVWHMRRQLAFDIWPLALAIFAICCFERGKILNPETSAWFDIFRIIFECTSAYSTIGLSMGTPSNNYSFSGELGTASKLVMILVMLRGRHRGLPVAIDRAVMLPREYSRLDRVPTAANGEKTRAMAGQDAFRAFRARGTGE